VGIPFAEKNMNLHCSDFFKLSDVFMEQNFGEILVSKQGVELFLRDNQG
jgi:hypothetical protein